MAVHEKYSHDVIMNRDVVSIESGLSLKGRVKSLPAVGPAISQQILV